MFTHEDLDYAQGTQLRLYAKNIGLKGRSKLKVKQLKDALRATLPPRQGTPPSLFVELCAGTAAVSLQLHREGAKPPVSRMGSKRGYAIAVLHALGLYPGQQAAHYLWCEPDDGCRLLLETYRDHDLALEVAAIIRGWKDEDPRALWDRLRKEGPVKAPTPRETARWTLGLPGGAWTAMPPKAMYKGPGCHSSKEGTLRQTTVAAVYEDLDTLPGEVTEEAVDPREVARWVQIESCTQITGGFDIAGNYGYQGDGYHWKAAPRGWQAERLESVEQLPATVRPDAVQVDPREVARWCYVAGSAYEQGNPKTGFAGPGANGGRFGDVRDRSSARCEDLPELPAEVADEAVDPREVGRWLYMCARCGSSPNPGKSYLPEDNPHEGWGGTGVSRATLARILPDTPTLPAEVTDEAVDPREAARWCYLAQTHHVAGTLVGGFVHPEEGGRFGAGRVATAHRISTLPTLSADLSDNAVEPPLLPPNTVVYIDPPYVNTSGYKHDLPRKRVVELALAWYAAGAKVAISEQEAIPELVAQGWVAVDITDKRLGQKRTFSNQQTEYLTLSPGAQCLNQPK